MHKRLHHVGIIINSEEKAKEFLDMYDLEVDYSGETPYQTKFYFTKVNTAYSESPLEILVPSGGKLAEYNNGKGGIHHLCFEVDDVEATSKEYLKKGYELLENPYAVSGGGRHKVNFIKPKSSCGILVELMEEVVL